MAGGCNSYSLVVSTGDDDCQDEITGGNAMTSGGRRTPGSN